METGLSDGSQVEIISGLEEGDTVYYLKAKSTDSSEGSRHGGRDRRRPCQMEKDLEERCQMACRCRMETLQAAADKEAREDSHSSGGHEDDQIQ